MFSNVYLVHLYDEWDCVVTLNVHLMGECDSVVTLNIHPFHPRGKSPTVGIESE
jgi:hypothetical protein